ncbi:CPBP family intramembrane glutamic endopeptidase [Cellulomonas aerilata]|uniref:CPBP family intramembrane glutamic endopeptidase n=1 Tax=Cellulomonas aerilata TaxID=515326 RepID=UPI001649D0CF|nr:CPBP family intramembrane glutamic endopeptidase [Cellulomonas aerilata]
MAAAWVLTVVLSGLPMIVLAAVAGRPPASLSVWVLLGVIPLVAVAWIWPPSRPLRSYSVVMLAAFCVGYVLQPVLAASLRGAGPVLIQLLVSRTVVVLLALVLAASLVKGLGLTRHQAFVAPGDLTARTRLRWPGTQRRVSWAVVATSAALVIFALVAAAGSPASGLGATPLRDVLPWTPVILACAAFNAFGEEVIYRSGPLATVVGVVGPTQAVLLTSLWFGLAHYVGSVPDGLGGVVASGGLALLLGRAMLATRGVAWPWLVHVAIDTAVFVSIALATV